MEQQDLLSDEIIDAPFSQKLKDNTRTAAVWARLSAIFAFISAGISLLQSLRQGSIFSAFIVAAINVTIAIFLFNFGNQTKKGLDNIDQPELEEGFNSLRRYFKILTIFLIVCVSLGILVIIYLASTTRSYNTYNF